MNQVLQNSQKWQAARQKLALHITNRQRIKQIYTKKGIQMLGEPELLFQDIQEKQLDLEKSLIYDSIKNELSQMGFIDFRYLAQGKQGYVLLAKQDISNKRFAIKGIPIRDTKGTILQENFDQAKKEVEMLKKCKGSPYVVNLLGQIEGKRFFYLILNECQGTLDIILKKSQNEKINELSAIKYSADIAEGLSYMHERKCICNDLKMDNILIDYNGNAVVSDLGLSDNITKTSGFGMGHYMGNLFYQAPECYDSKQFTLYSEEYKKLGVNVQQEPSTKSESFSLGYLIYVMLEGQNMNQVFTKHQPLQYSNKFYQLTYSQKLKQVIDGLTQFVPSNRLSIKQALVMLREIVSIEFQEVQNFIEVMEDDELATTQKTISEYTKEIEFVQSYSNHFYPIIKNEQALLTEISLNPNEGQMKQEAVIAELQKSNSNLAQKVQQQEIAIQNLQKKQDSTIAELQKANNLLNMKVQQQDQSILSLQKQQENAKQELLNANNSFNLKIQQYDQIILSIQKKQETAQIELQKNLESKYDSRLAELLTSNDQLSKKLNEQNQNNTNLLNKLQNQEAKIDEQSKKINFLTQKLQEQDQSKLDQQAILEELQAQIIQLSQKQQGNKDQIYSNQQIKQQAQSSNNFLTQQANQQGQFNLNQYQQWQQQPKLEQQIFNYQVQICKIRMEGFLNWNNNKVYDLNKKQIGMLKQWEYNKDAPLFNIEMTQQIGILNCHISNPRPRMMIYMNNKINQNNFNSNPNKKEYPFEDYDKPNMKYELF